MKNKAISTISCYSPFNSHLLLSKKSPKSGNLPLFGVIFGLSGGGRPDGAPPRGRGRGGGIPSPAQGRGCLRIRHPQAGII